MVDLLAIVRFGRSCQDVCRVRGRQLPELGLLEEVKVYGRGIGAIPNSHHSGQEHDGSSSRVSLELEFLPRFSESSLPIQAPSVSDQKVVDNNGEGVTISAIVPDVPVSSQNLMAISVSDQGTSGVPMGLRHDVGNAAPSSNLITKQAENQIDNHTIASVEPSVPTIAIDEAPVPSVQDTGEELMRGSVVAIATAGRNQQVSEPLISAITSDSLETRGNINETETRGDSTNDNRTAIEMETLPPDEAHCQSKKGKTKKRKKRRPRTRGALSEESEDSSNDCPFLEYYGHLVPQNKSSFT
ncbi:hypothetical protein NE237_030902 [Protea cynaroides]|uniref:Uncharacterized protein n=1 Tax=Protea cynaroides TaxID=273540 RepID=A0A9Q0GX25_9MAGN|nr:hypothetical protein NE237_030902 [Protea cynaroides]